MNYKLTAATDADKTLLADIRAEAMRPSLEALGRFDPIRVRERFLSKFNPTNTTNIWMDGQIIGFFVLNDKADALWLEDLYFLNTYQGKGMGKAIMNNVKNMATQQNSLLKLQALRDSPANIFYQNCDFVETHQEQWDIYYQWSK